MAPLVEEAVVVLLLVVVVSVLSTTALAVLDEVPSAASRSASRSARV